ncbi:MAG TPA: hypothetical protein VFI73_05800 [Candidatus Nitrosopolaris sp.]|nr:hypothetical protein [Candidatus Nitrosopolaris sp.]
MTEEQNNAAIFADFVKVVNRQNKYNNDGIIKAIPLITFHDVDLATNQPCITNAVSVSLKFIDGTFYLLRGR